MVSRESVATSRTSTYAKCWRRVLPELRTRPNRSTSEPSPQRFKRQCPSGSVLLGRVRRTINQGAHVHAEWPDRFSLQQLWDSPRRRDHVRNGRMRNKKIGGRLRRLAVAFASLITGLSLIGPWQHARGAATVAVEVPIADFVTFAGQTQAQPGDTLTTVAGKPTSSGSVGVATMKCVVTKRGRKIIKRVCTTEVKKVETAR